MSDQPGAGLNVDRPGQIEDLRPLTSLRFVAAALIVFYHAANSFPWAQPLQGLPLHQGVSFFFVLSGFILSHVYSQKTVGYGRFLWTRFARLWPVHFVTCLMVILFIRADSQQFGGTGFFNPWVVLASNVTLTHALVPYLNYAFSWNSVSWSISTEAFFYLAFPWLLIDIRNTWHWKLGACVAIIILYAALVRLFGIPDTSELERLGVRFLTYASPLFRAFEFVLGMTAYVLWRRLGRLRVGALKGNALEIAALALLALWSLWGYRLAEGVFQMSVTGARWFDYAGSAWICAVLIVILASAQGLVGKALSWRLFVWLGEISFAMYMVHQIILKWIVIKKLENVADLTSAPIVLGACVLGGALLHHLVELPARRLILGEWKPWRGLGGRRGASPASN